MMKNKNIKFYRLSILPVIGLIMLALTGNLLATEAFVSGTGSDITGDGTVGNPYQTVVKAISSISFRDTITIMPGSYQGSPVYLFNSITIRGQSGADQTTFSGIDNLTIFRTDYLSGDVIIEDLTFTNSGRAVFLDNSNSTVRNCKFFDCSSDSTGGAIFSVNAIPVIHDNLFKRCSATFNGGAIFGYVSGMKIYNNIFDSCFTTSAFSDGGGVGIYYHYGDVERNLVQNNVFRYCEAYNGGGIHLSGRRTDIYNNLFHDCSANNGAGIYVGYDDNPFIYNNNFVNNTPDGMYHNGFTLSNYDYNNYYNNSPTNGCPGCPAATNIYTVNPLFEDFANYDYHLTDGSGLINVGKNILPNLLNIDYENDKRRLSQAVDIGPDEYVDCSISGDFFVVEDTAGCPGLMVQLQTTNLTGYYDSLIWDFGDGFKDYNLTNPVHIYSDTGHFDITLTVSTPCTTVTAFKENLIHIRAVPIPDFSSDVVAGCVPLEVSFSSALSFGGENYAWDFGDGSTSLAANPLHTYDTAGTYNVKLTASNICGADSVIKSGYIAVVPLASAEFTSEIRSGSAPLNVPFFDLSENNPISWNWDFGDDGFSFAQDPIYRYFKPGLFDVTLVCANDCDIPDTIIKTEYIRVFGFESVLYDSVRPNKHIYEYDFLLDSLFGLYEDQISLRAEVINNPTRGSITMEFNDSTVNLFDSTTLTVNLSKDVPRGEYDIR